MTASFDFVIEVTVDGKKFPTISSGFDSLADELELGRRNITALLKRELKIFLDAVAKELATIHGGSYPSGTTNTSMSKRSGLMVKSLERGAFVKGRGVDDVSGGITVDRRYAIHETGGIIRPKRSKYLTIPLSAATDSNGNPLRMSARQWDNTFLAVSKAGNLIIFRKTGNTIKPLYLLVGPKLKADSKVIGAKRHRPITQIEFKKGGRGRGKGPARLGVEKLIQKRITRLEKNIVTSILAEIDKHG